MFDIGNRLQSVAGRATHTYDGHGRRAYTAYADGSWQWQLYDHAGRLRYTHHSQRGATRHVYLGSQLIAETSSATGHHYIHTDALGSPVARTNPAAQITSRTVYEPYGATAAVPGSSAPVGIGFTGHANDAESALVYMQQRYYDPIAGRFLSVDPVVTDEKTGWHFNRYVYGENNPYRYVDPDGRAPRHPDPMLQRAQTVGQAVNTLARIATSKASPQAQVTGLSQNAASREAKREVGIPTSQQAASQTNGKVTDSGTGEQVAVGRQQTYEVAKPGGGTETMSVQVSRDIQGVHKGMPQIEAGKVKDGGQTDAAGRPRIQNEGKVRVDFNPEK